MYQLKKHLPDLCVESLVTQSPAQFGQDIFTIAMTNAKQNGRFLDIGAGHPYFMSNTYILEKNFNWSGVCIDQVDRSTDQYQWPTIRKKSQFLLSDATKVDYKCVPVPFDFLQIDLDSIDPSLIVLKKVLEIYEFSVIVFEHDIGHNTQNRQYLKSESQRIIEAHGYEMVINNVTVPPEVSIDKPFFFHHIEDWYVNPNTVPRDTIDAYKWIDLSNNPKFPKDILFSK
jgi:hypothetical protein